MRTKKNNYKFNSQTYDPKLCEHGKSFKPHGLKERHPSLPPALLGSPEHHLLISKLDFI